MSKNVAGARAFLSGYGKSYSQLDAEGRERLARWYGIHSAADIEGPAKRLTVRRQAEAEHLSKMERQRMRKAPKKRAKKAPVKKVRAHEIVDAACKNRHLPSFLRKRYY